MDQKEVFDKVIAILKPFAKDQAALAQAGLETLIMKDLRINSARLVDVVLELEERFGIQVKDEEADNVRTVGDAVKLVVSKVG
jgi:acyl carrier protein